MQVLLTKDIEAVLPPLRSSSDIASVKFFTPWTHWTWFAAEASAELDDGSEVPLSDPLAAKRCDVLFFGLVYGLEKEYGYWRLSELESIRGPAGLRVERDVDFRPTPLDECKDPTKRL